MAKLNELKNDLDWVQSIAIEQAKMLDLTAYAIAQATGYAAGIYWHHPQRLA